MNDSKHTPGPWKWRKHYADMSNEDGAEVFSSEPYEGMWLSSGPAQDANARLIAAAPELLESLEDADTWICELLPAQSTGGDRLDSIRSAIAKAKGEAP